MCIIYTDKMSEEDARRRLVQKLSMAYATNDYGGDMCGAGVKRKTTNWQKYIQGACSTGYPKQDLMWQKYIKKCAAAYKAKMKKKLKTKKAKTATKSKTKKKTVGRPRKAGRPKKVATKSKTMTKSKAKKVRKPHGKCACFGTVVLRSGKLGSRCLYYDQPSCDAYDNLSASKQKLLKPQFLTNAQAKRHIAKYGSGISGGCDDCEGEGFDDYDGGVLVDDFGDYSGAALIGDQEFY